jgi:MFS family permease
VVVAAFAAFAAFGSFWGVWGASVPRVQHQAGVSDGQLGFALLFVGAGALPAMLLAGRALDRWGPKVAAGAIGLLGLVGAGLALTAVDLPSLAAGLAITGASSGAADVTMNAVAGRAERFSGRPVITRVHGTFSASVVLASLGTGITSAASWPLAVPFLALTVLCLAAGAVMFRVGPAGAPATGTPSTRPPATSTPTTETPTTSAPATGTPTTDTPATSAPTSSALATDTPTTDTPAAGTPATRTSATGAPAADPLPGRLVLVPLLLVGALGALAFASENAHQSWSAVFAQDELHAGAGLTTVAPAVFAGTVAITRFASGALRAAHARALILAGGLAAGGGALVIAGAPTLLIAICGLVLAGAGTAVLFPTLLGIVSRNVEETYRGRATSIVSTVSYLGFLFGPVYVGAWAGATGLRGAMIAVAALAAALVVLTPLLLRLSGFTTSG